MTTENLIPVSEVCFHHHVELSFVRALGDSGLIEFIITEGNIFVDPSHLPTLEKMIRLHIELNINLEGLEAVNHLLEQNENLRAEIQRLENQLRFFEQGKN